MRKAHITHPPRRAVLALLAGSALLASMRRAGASVLAPSGTLRASFIAQNPVQAYADKATGELRGPAAELTVELARREGVPFAITGAAGASGVIDRVLSGAADIGYLAYDPVRAKELDFTQTYALAQNTYLVPASSPLQRCAEVDRPNIRIAVGERDAGDYFLTRTLQHATLRRIAAGSGEEGLRLLREASVEAYAANRQRLAEFAARASDMRLMPDNFYAVEQAIALRKGETAALALLGKFLDEARSSGLIEGAIRRAGLVGLDVAPPREQQRR
jgi:polar amino acid transport system substrate-binding protein